VNYTGEKTIVTLGNQKHKRDTKATLAEEKVKELGVRKKEGKVVRERRRPVLAHEQRFPGSL